MTHYAGWLLISIVLLGGAPALAHEWGNCTELPLSGAPPGPGEPLIGNIENESEVGTFHFHH